MGNAKARIKHKKTQNKSQLNYRVSSIIVFDRSVKAFYIVHMDV